MNRRELLTHAGALSALATLLQSDALAQSGTAAPGPGTAPAAPREPSAPRDPAGIERTEALARMRCAPDGGWAMWVYSGMLLVKPEGEVARPAVRIEGFSFNRVLRRGAGDFEYQLDEVGWYCDLDSGEVLERWRNPFTGREVRPGHYRSPQKTRFNAGRVVPLDALPAGIDYRGEIVTLGTPAGLRGVTEDLYVRLPPRPAAGGRPAQGSRVMASLATHVAASADLARPASEWLDCTLQYATMNTFAGWLGMEGIAGVQNMRLMGRKVRADALDALPGWLLERARRDHPTFLELPKT